MDKILNISIDENRETQIRSEEFKGIRDDILGAIQQLAKNHGEMMSVQELPNDDVMELKTELSRKITYQIERETMIATQRKVLHSLYVPQMEDRQSRIEVAHAGTFKWIFREDDRQPHSWPNFKRWLREENGIYWLAGKAGSGKSTLMKYLYNNRRTHQALKQWAGEEQLVIAKFYFWNPGTPLQKSHEGFLRSVLYEILKQCPDWIPIVLPWRWDSYRLYGSNFHPWTFWELSNAFSNLMTEKCKSTTRFCFFVDGLDEYDGDHANMADLFRKLASTTSDATQDLPDGLQDTSSKPSAWASNVKICVSSRPWLVFEDAFKDCPTLMLQDLTSKDIKLYVTKTLGGNANFQRSAKGDPQHGELISDIVKRASGVFLWVFLVVESLIEGLRDGDTISNLKERVETLPTDLEEYFQHILNRIEKRYLLETAQMFEATLTARKPLSLMTFSYLSEKDPNHAINAEVRAISDQQLSWRLESARRRVLSRSKGLLEVYQSASTGVFSNHTVDYLHRTVRDFLRSNNVNRMLRFRIEEDFDSNVSLCGSYLAQIKAFPIALHGFEGIRPLFKLVAEALRYASLAEKSTGKSQGLLLRSLDLTMSQYQQLPTLRSHHFVNENRSGTWSDSFLSLAIEANLPLYVTEQLEQEPNATRSKQQRPMLDYALRRFMYCDTGGPRWIKKAFLQETEKNSVEFMPPNPKMIRALLKTGSDPNEKHDKSTIWIQFLKFLYENSGEITRDHQRDSMETIKVLLDGGADPDILCPIASHLITSKQNHSEVDSRSRESKPIETAGEGTTTYLTLYTIVEAAFESYGGPEYASLLASIAEKKKHKNSLLSALTVTKGNLTVTKGNLTVTKGNLTVTNGNGRKSSGMQKLLSRFKSHSN
jgi:hypothetical protein